MNLLFWFVWGVGIPLAASIWWQIFTNGQPRQRGDAQDAVIVGLMAIWWPASLSLLLIGLAGRWIASRRE